MEDRNLTGLLSSIAISLLLLASSWARAEDLQQPFTYLALGDSLAYGMQVGKLKEQISKGAVRAENFATGYIDEFSAHLRTRYPNMRVVDLGCPGETTMSFLEGPCAFAVSGKPFGTTPLPLHSNYQGSQMSAAMAYLADGSQPVDFITLDIGINDLRAVQIGCPAGEKYIKCVDAALPAALQHTATNLKDILGHIRSASPKAKILMPTYFNWLAVVDPESDKHVIALNKIIETAAAAAGAKTVDVFAAFNRNGDERQQLCLLTLFCGATKDLHPSDEGYKVIGDLLAAALRPPN